MVSFSCESCGDVLTKKKLDLHRNRCYGATFTCIDCMVYFPGTSYRSHTSCMTEDQKYQGALYKAKKPKGIPNHPNQPNQLANRNMPNATVYVEDVPDDVFDDYQAYEGNSDDDAKSPAEQLPEAPTPPAAPEAVNVFDFLVASNTPNASTVNFPHHSGAHDENTQLVRYDAEANGHADTPCAMGDELVHYGTGPIATNPYQTPAPKAARKKTRDSDVKTDKKRKRLHIATDHIMTDAPPVLHSGLTGGLNRLMKSTLPLSPDYSGGDAAPISPIKKSKQSKSSKSNRQETNSLGTNLLALVTSGTKAAKPKKKKKKSPKKQTNPAHDGKTPKLIEYRPSSRDSKKGADDAGQMVVYKPRVDLFLSYVTKGPESERGCSVNKALKRYHRARSDSGENLNKQLEEKELWKSLRLRRNDRGEIVVFGL